MHLHRFEKIWLMVGGATLVLFLVVLSVNAYAMGMMPPSHMKMIDPNKVDETAPFDNPGLHETGENEYDLVMSSMVFAFQPNQVEVPVGAKVKFIVTSKDVVHGFQIPKTNVNIMVLPGHISEVTHTFDEPGTYLIICNEYCGSGHQIMAATIIVK
ncbi:cytochrome c oxidase subunit II [Brevibacillus daliensis]|uniref:cytochrome c oxidase subunit II n=1 Tax=Brevibacillus daliensis TaxID=2892995 RepID=UPI001E3597CA|nr:cytochrome c oxidase subunit II [Brevibacillus daliensis]